jgi:hypothetical protein
VLFLRARATTGKWREIENPLRHSAKHSTAIKSGNEI